MLAPRPLTARVATVLAVGVSLLGASGTAAIAAKPSPAVHVRAVHAKIRVYLFNTFFVSRQAVTVQRRSLHVGGVVTPYRPGQWVKLRVYLGSRLMKVARLRLRRSKNGAYGHFKQTLSLPSIGNVAILIGHSRTHAMQSFLGRRSLAVLDTSAGFGSTGRFVELLQQRLAALHFYVAQSGVYDAGTGLAIDAFHRLQRWGTYQTLDGRTINWLLNGWGGFKVRFPRHGKHAEGNLGLQLLALINGSHVYRIYPISSGKPSTPTILGSFHVYSKVPGYLPDGMYYSNFFFRGYAIHGYNPAPDYPASHGCMRLPITDATSVFDWLNVGDGVDVYY